jgi:hypothetical protein
MRAVAPVKKKQKTTSLYSLVLQSEYKVGGAYVQFTVKPPAEVSLMTVDLNIVLRTVLSEGNLVLRLMTWVTEVK